MREVGTEKSAAAQVVGCLGSALRVGLGLIAGALVGIVLGVVVGVGLAMIFGVI